MTLFANDHGETVDAWDAVAKKCYYCLECSALLKVRKAKNRFPHFYHLKAAPSCRLYSKSNEHLLVQLEIQKHLPIGEAVLEKPFPSIHRIADVAWEKKKIVFEIQCSSISEKEACARHSEYQSVGYEVIWILDDRRFNKKHLRPPEEFLRKQSCYFVSCRGPLLFYDQLEIVAKHKRVKKTSQMPIHFSKIQSIQPARWPDNLPSSLHARILHCKYFFENDALYRTLRSFQNPSTLHTMQNWILLEQFWTKKEIRTVKTIFHSLFHLYISLFNKFFN